MISPQVLVVPDKFKGTLTAVEAARAIEEGLLRVAPDWRVEVLPFADGGDGTVDAVLHVGGTLDRTEVSGPTGERVGARWAALADTAVIEVAEACGLRLLEPDPETSLTADSAGVGELISAALDAGYRRIALGIGGSATTDAGAGVLRALGVRVLDANGAVIAAGGESLRDAVDIDTTGLDARLADTEVILCSDVLSPYCGPRGAAAVFGPQKGADDAAVQILDEGLVRFAAAVRRATEIDLTADLSGGGAGGMVGGLRAILGAQVVSGVDFIADLVDLEDRLRQADLVVVGEGSLDAQSLFGKAPAGISARAREAGVPVAAVVGVSTLDPDTARTAGIGYVVSAVEHAGSVEAALADPSHWVSAAAAAVVDWFNEEGP